MGRPRLTVGGNVPRRAEKKGEAGGLGGRRTRGHEALDA
jgi:hypothetical protein